MDEYEFSFFSKLTDRDAATIADLEFYKSIKSGKWKSQVERVRAAATDEDRTKAKEVLPVAIPSALCDGGHAAANVKSHSGLLSLDFDLKDNANVRNFSEFKSLIGQVKYIRFCSLSCSGKGFWATMPLIAPERHREQADAAVAYFARFGLQADVKCKDVTRARFVTYDESPYYNSKAEPFPFILENSQNGQRVCASQTDENDYADACKYLDAMGSRDLSQDGEVWRKVGYGFAHSFGEDGRELFHRFSQNYPDYSPDECDKRYTGFLRSPCSMQTASAKSFFKLCLLNGVKIEPEPQRASADEDFKDIDLEG